MVLHFVGAPASPTARGPFRQAALLFLLPLAIVAGLALERALTSRELERLPVSDRQALYLQTRAGLQRTCGDPPGPLPEDWCRRQAEFLRRFPACDGPCQALADRFGPRPSR